MEVERTMSGQLQSLKLQLQRKGGHSRQQDEELISAMREQVTTEKETTQAAHAPLNVGCGKRGEKCVSFGDNPALAGSKWPERSAPRCYFSHSEVSVPAAGSTCAVLHSSSVSGAGEPAAPSVCVFNDCIAHMENVTQHDKRWTDSWTLLSCASISFFLDWFS